MILRSFNTSATWGGLTGTSSRVGMRPRRVRNCSASRLSMKFAASCAALGSGACALMPTEPKNSATGSSAQNSIGAPASAPDRSFGGLLRVALRSVGSSASRNCRTQQ
jgi:hypothetical protein